jgi:ATP/maltotriose-dependent transcriptional regulator MalT
MLSTVEQSGAAQAALDEVRTLLQGERFQEASCLMAESIEMFLDGAALPSVQSLLTAFPTRQFEEDAYLRFVEGMVYARRGQATEALNLLERARFSFMHTERDYGRAVVCALEMSRVRQSHEDFRTAYYHLYDEVAPLISAGLVQDPLARGQYLLRLAELAPDMGRLQESNETAAEALRIFREANDVAGQFRALARLATTACEVGDLSAADSWVDLAARCLDNGDLGKSAQARLVNLRLHLAWHHGDLEKALRLAEDFRNLADNEQFRIYRLYARILAGNLLRGLGRFQEAGRWYAETQELIHKLSHDRYQPWLDVQMGWLRALEGRLGEARALVQSALQTSDLGQAMSFKVFLAVVNILDGHLAVAQSLLNESRTFYTASGDELSVYAIGLYQALVALRQGDETTALKLLARSLGWMDRRRIDYFPHWWHPALVAEVCAFAAVAACCGDTSERILLRRLRREGAPALRRYVLDADPQRRNHSRRLLRMLGVSPMDVLDGVRKEPVRTVLEEYLLDGRLRWEGFHELWSELVSANHRRTPNPTMVAVFALFVNGASRREIAGRLGCAASTVRNHITVIYHHFGLPDPHGERHVRHDRLAEIAFERGFISRRPG